jgi:hypothetical protein
VALPLGAPMDRELTVVPAQADTPVNINRMDAIKTEYICFINCIVMVRCGACASGFSGLQKHITKFLSSKKQNHHPRQGKKWTARASFAWYADSPHLGLGEGDRVNCQWEGFGRSGVSLVA